MGLTLGGSFLVGEGDPGCWSWTTPEEIGPRGEGQFWGLGLSWVLGPAAAPGAGAGPRDWPWGLVLETGPRKAGPGDWL